MKNEVNSLHVRETPITLKPEDIRERERLQREAMKSEAVAALTRAQARSRLGLLQTENPGEIPDDVRRDIIKATNEKELAMTLVKMFVVDLKTRYDMPSFAVMNDSYEWVDRKGRPICNVAEMEARSAARHDLAQLEEAPDA